MREHHVQRCCVDLAGKANPQPAVLDLDQAHRHSSRRGRCRRTCVSYWRAAVPRRSGVLDAQRHKHPGAIRCLPHRRASPRLQQPAGNAAPTRQRRDIHPRLQALCHQCRLLFSCPSTPPRNSRDQLDPAILAAFVPVLMHGIIAATIHPAHPQPQSPSLRLDPQLPVPRGGGLAAVTVMSHYPEMDRCPGRARGVISCRAHVVRWPHASPGFAST